MSTWLKSIDDSFDPIDDYAAAYAAEYRVWYRYVGPGSAGKHWTAAEMAHWHAQGPDTFCGFLAEGVGDEPLTNPGIGDDQGASARRAMNALGVPAHVLCSPAMDRNVTKTQTLGTITTYMRNWKQGFGGLPVPYIEVENGGRLVDEGVSAGTFTPAAYLWGEKGDLITPENAPAHVVQTQERNGRDEFGGNVDTGHTRAGAPHVWWDRPGGRPPTPSGEEFDVSEVRDVWDSADVDVITPNASITADTNPSWRPKGTLEWLVNHVDGVETAVGPIANLATTIAAQGKKIDGLVTTINALVAGGTSVDTATIMAKLDALAQEESEQVQALQAEVTDLRTRLTAAAQAEATALGGATA